MLAVLLLHCSHRTVTIRPEVFTVIGTGNAHASDAGLATYTRLSIVDLVR